MPLVSRLMFAMTVVASAGAFGSPATDARFSLKDPVRKTIQINVWELEQADFAKSLAEIHALLAKEAATGAVVHYRQQQELLGYGLYTYLTVDNLCVQFRNAEAYERTLAKLDTLHRSAGHVTAAPVEKCEWASVSGGDSK